MGFIPGMQELFNISISFNMVFHFNKRQTHMIESYGESV